MSGCPTCDPKYAEPLDSETVDQGHTVNVAWHGTVEYPRNTWECKILADADGITATRSDDGKARTRFPLPERYSTRISLAQLILGASFDLNAQPDHPEPVDPASVAKVKAEALREVADIWYSDEGPEDGSWATWLRSRANELDPPEPDPAAVEVLADVFRDVLRRSDPEAELDEEWIDRHAHEMAKRNVRVVSPDE